MSGRRAGRAVRLGVVLGLMVTAGPAAAETFTSAEVLAWSEKGQRFYFQTSIGMAGIIAAQVDQEQAKCIDKWHSGQNENGYTAVFTALRRYPEYHPQGVILALLRKACGGYK